MLGFKNKISGKEEVLDFFSNLSVCICIVSFAVSVGINCSCS